MFHSGQQMTHEDFMKIMQDYTIHHNQFLEVPLVALTLLAGFLIELLSFLTDSDAVVLLDNLLTMLLPHFGLFINTVSWGDLCIESSLVFQIVGFDLMGKIGFITLGTMVALIIMLFVLLICDFNPNGPVFFLYGCVGCLFLFYVVTVDIVSLYCSPYIVRILFYSKFGATALCMMISNDII